MIFKVVKEQDPIIFMKDLMWFHDYFQTLPDDDDHLINIWRARKPRAKIFDIEFNDIIFHNVQHIQINEKKGLTIYYTGPKDDYTEEITFCSVIHPNYLQDHFNDEKFIIKIKEF